MQCSSRPHPPLLPLHESGEAGGALPSSAPGSCLLCGGELDQQASQGLARSPGQPSLQRRHHVWSEAGVRRLPQVVEGSCSLCGAFPMCTWQALLCYNSQIDFCVISLHVVQVKTIFLEVRIQYNPSHPNVVSSMKFWLNINLCIVALYHKTEVGSGYRETKATN